MKAAAGVLLWLLPALVSAQPSPPMPAGERAVELADQGKLREQARTTSLYAGVPPSAVLERKEDMRPRWTVTAFSILWSRPTPQGGERAPHWVARKVDADGRRLSTVYADSRSCPALLEVLKRAELLEVPQPRFIFSNPARRDGRSEIVLHDTGYRLTADARFASGADGQVQLSGGSRSPLAAWADSLMRTLAPCWTDQVPPVH